MPITEERIKEVLNGKPTRNRASIRKAVAHEEDVRLHCETEVNPYRTVTNPAFTRFLNFVQLLLPADKFEMFKTLVRYPLPTVSFTDTIFTTLSKVFDGRNPVFDYNFVNPETAQDWRDYLDEELGGGQYWEEEGWETMKTRINSVMILDLPAEQEPGDRYPRPYGYFLPVASLIDFEMVDDEQFDWLIFKTDEGKIAVYDDEQFRIYEAKGTSDIDWSKDHIANSHDLEYCPARFYWSTAISSKERLIKRHPVTNFLWSLDMLLFYLIANEHLNLFGRFPVTWAFKQDCDFRIPETGLYCSDGYLKQQSEAGDNYVLDGANNPRPCPICDERRLNGPGSLIEVDPPGVDNENTNLREPVGHVAIPRESLDYNKTDIAERKSEIFTAVTGYRGMSINDKAVNEKQVGAIFETLETALLKIQMNIEKARTWWEETAIRLRYPKGVFIGATISLGTEHYLLDADVLLDLYQSGKEKGFGTAFLDAVEDQYFTTKYRNNPERLERYRMIANLDPFRHLTTEEVKNLFESDLVRPVDYVLKANFSSFLTRFERENVAITEFGLPLDYNLRIERIGQALRTYAEELIPEEADPPPPPPPVPPPINAPPDPNANPSPGQVSGE